jgi:4-amino-4-deoxy-L-arabinose transferase-like glycosyltransferase
MGTGSRDLGASAGPRALRWLLWMILTCVAGWLLFVAPPRGALWNDPAAYAYAARRMVESGDWLTLHAETFTEPDRPYVNKPPLLFWLAAVGYAAAGGPSRAVVAGSQLLGAALVLLTAWWGNRLVGRPWGFVAALGLVATPVFLDNATDLRMETGLGLGVIGACCAASLPPGPRARWRPPIFFAAIGVALLSKGATGALPLVAAPLGHWLAGRSARSLWAARRRWLAWAWLLAIPLAWWIQLALRIHGLPLRAVVETHGGSVLPWRMFLDTAVLPLWRDRPLWLVAAGIGAALVVARIAELRRRGDVERAAACAVPAAFALLYLAGWAIKPFQFPRYACAILPLVTIAATLPLAAFWARRPPLRFAAPVAAAALLASLAGPLRGDPVARAEAAEDARFLAALRELVGDSAPGFVYVPAFKENASYRRRLHHAWFLTAFYAREPRLVDPAAPGPDAPAVWVGVAGKPLDELLARSQGLALEPALEHERLRLRVWRVRAGPSAR